MILYLFAMQDSNLLPNYTYEIWAAIKSLAFLFLLLKIADYIISPPAIKHLSLVYTPVPILGGLILIIPKPKLWLSSPCLQFQNLSKIYGEVFQVKFGNKLIVVANSYSAVKQLWCSNNVKGNNSRPVTYSFHKVLSKTGIFTIGSTPMSQTYKNSRKHISEHILSEKRNKEFNFDVIDKSCNQLVASLISKSKIEDSKRVVSDDLLLKTQYFHLKIALWLTYGFEINFEDPLHCSFANDIIRIENRITKVRSHIQNLQDYLPFWIRIFYNLFSSHNPEFKELYKSRNNYLNLFHNYAKQVYEDIKNNEVAILCEQRNIDDLKNTLMYNYFNEKNSKITFEELTSECLTMVSAGLDNTPLNFKYGIHMLCNFYPNLWNIAFESLLTLYNNDVEKAYNSCSVDFNNYYVLAIVEETLRLFTVLPLSLPRETTANVIYQNSVIPSKTTLFMNCWAANHDEKVFPEPMYFKPERWLVTVENSEKHKTVKMNTSLKHFAFGAGCRKCLGANFARRELYVLFAKLILKFKPATTTDIPPTSHPLKLNMYPESLAIEPIPFDIHLEIRQ